MKQRYKIFVALLLGAAVAISGCSSSKDSGGPQGRVLGKATKPGILPDGTQVPKLSPEETQKSFEALAGTMTVVQSVVDAMPFQAAARSSRLSGFGSVLTKRLGVFQGLRLLQAGDSDRLRDVIVINCNVAPFETVTTDGQASRSGNRITMPISARGSGAISGSVLCPVESSTDFSGDGLVTGVIGANDELTSLTLQGRALFRQNLEVTDAVVIEETGFRSLSGQLQFSGSLGLDVATDELGSVNADVSGNVVIDTVKFGTWDATLLSELDIKISEVAKAPATGASGDVKIALIFQNAGKTLLIQIFARAEQPDQLEIYINGERIKKEDLRAR